MKKVGLIDNLQDIEKFRFERFDSCTSEELMAATGGNTGNVAFVHAVRKILGNPIVRIDWGWRPELVRQSVDHIVVCCANQIGSHVELTEWAIRLKSFDLPVTLIGLGAQSSSLKKMPDVPEGTKSFLNLVAQLGATQRPNIASRGEFSTSVIDCCGARSLSLGCPSTLISNGDVASILRTKIDQQIHKVAIASGNPWHKPSASLEQKLVELVNRYDGDYILQHPLSMFRFALDDLDSNTDPDVVEHFREILGFDNQNTMRSWLKRKSVFFIDAPSWIRYLKRCDLAVGARFHGVALAVQGGVPGTVITIDSRTEELCLSSGIKNISVAETSSLSPIEIMNLARWTADDVEKFENARIDCANKYFDFLSSNLLSPSEHLRRLLGAAR